MWDNFQVFGFGPSGPLTWDLGQLPKLKYHHPTDEGRSAWWGVSHGAPAARPSTTCSLGLIITACSKRGLPACQALRSAPVTSFSAHNTPVT